MRLKKKSKFLLNFASSSRTHFDDNDDAFRCPDAPRSLPTLSVLKMRAEKGQRTSSDPSNAPFSLSSNQKARRVASASGATAKTDERGRMKFHPTRRLRPTQSRANFLRLSGTESRSRGVPRPNSGPERVASLACQGERNMGSPLALPQTNETV